MFFKKINQNPKFLFILLQIFSLTEYFQWISWKKVQINIENLRNILVFIFKIQNLFMKISLCKIEWKMIFYMSTPYISLFFKIWQISIKNVTCSQVKNKSMINLKLSFLFFFFLIVYQYFRYKNFEWQYIRIKVICSTTF